MSCFSFCHLKVKYFLIFLERKFFFNKLIYPQRVITAIFQNFKFHFLQYFYKNIWAIHTTLYRVCCIKHTWLFVNAQFYAVLCISHSKCIFWHLNNLITRNQHYFWKKCVCVSDFYKKIINNKHTLLYNIPTIH